MSVGFVIFEFPDVFVPIGKGIGAKAIVVMLGLVRRAWRQSKTLPRTPKKDEKGKAYGYKELHAWNSAR